MVKKSNEQLRKERDALLSGARRNASESSLSKQKAAENRKLKAEIFALRHPGSKEAKANLKKASVGIGKFIAKRAAIVNENLRAMEEEERRAEKKRQARNRRPTPKRKPTQKKRTTTKRRSTR